MIKFDFTSHFIIVLSLMVILVSTLIIINSSVNSKWGMGPFILLCPRTSSQYVTPLVSDDLGFSNAIQLDMVYGCRFNIFCFPMPT